MSIDVLLLLLRLLSGLFLLALLLVLLFALWRDFSRTTADQQTIPRRYGLLVVLREMDGKLLVTGETHPLAPVTTIGRSPGNAVPIADSFASSEHALITLRSGQWWVEDRRSRNGTLLNDLPVTQPTVVTHGDIIGIGAVKLRLEIDT